MSHGFLLDVYRVTAALPSEERYGLTSQLRRAALSVPTNIVEGSRRHGRQDYSRFLNLAEASLTEAEYLLTVCVDLNYLTLEAVQPLSFAAGRIARKLFLLRSKVEGVLNTRVEKRGPTPPTRQEAACLARSTPPSMPSDPHSDPVPAPDASAKRDALNASGDSRDALNASAKRDALNASRTIGELSTSRSTARSTAGRPR
jgi:four helix bundle protein